MERPSPPPPRRSIAEGIALIVVGLVIFIPSGLCTGFLVFAPIIASLSNPRAASESSMAAIAIVIGGPFVLGGGVLLWLGFKHVREYYRDRDTRKSDHF